MPCCPPCHGEPRENCHHLGFLGTTPPAELVTVSPRITLVVSRFSLLTKAVTMSTYHLSSLVGSDMMRGTVSLIAGLVVGAIWATTLMGLVALPVSMPGEVFTSGLAGRAMACLSGGASAGPSGVWPMSTAVGKGVDFASRAFSLGREGMGQCAPQGPTELDLHASNVNWGRLGNRAPLWGHQIPVHSLWGNSLQVPEDVSLIEGEVPPHLSHQLHDAHCQGAVI